MKNVKPDNICTCITKPSDEFRTDMTEALNHIGFTNLSYDADYPSDIYITCADENYDGLSVGQFCDEISAYYDAKIVSVCYNDIHDEVILFCDKGENNV